MKSTMFLFVGLILIELVGSFHCKKTIGALLISTVGLHGGIVPCADAFENAIRIVDIPKTHGPAPTNLGLDSKGLLRKCLKVKCFHDDWL